MRIISIELVEPVSTVYDIETEAGTFVAGGQINGILVKNTDSCYVSFKDIHKSDFLTENDFMLAQFKKAKECAVYCTKQFKPPMSLEFEKFMYPFILFAKKRYAYLEWSEGHMPCKEPGYKGIQVVRRDNCKFVKEELTNIFKIIMNAKSKEEASTEAIDCVQRAVKTLLDNKVPIEKLVLTKQLKGEYAVRANKESTTVHWTDPRITQPHVRLAQKLRAVNPACCPKPPDRVPYVFIEKKTPLQCDKVASPEDAVGKKIDGLYYFEHQFKEPIDMLFQFMVENPNTLYERMVLTKINQINGQREITSFFK
jgi:DNA polymerase delta subunit 1